MFFDWLDNTIMSYNIKTSNNYDKTKNKKPFYSNLHYSGMQFTKYNVSYLQHFGIITHFKGSNNCYKCAMLTVFFKSVSQVGNNPIHIIPKSDT